MNNITDLNIESEILPLFDFTLNDFTKDRLIQLLNEPLNSMVDIETRQGIIKSFLKNQEIFSNYSYSRVDYYEVHQFIHDASIQTHGKSNKWELLFSEKQRHQLRAKFIQMVVLYRHLQVSYFKRLDATHFPADYKTELFKLNDFFVSWQIHFP